MVDGEAGRGAIETWQAALFNREHLYATVNTVSVGEIPYGLLEFQVPSKVGGAGSTEERLAMPADFQFGTLAGRTTRPMPDNCDSHLLALDGGSAVSAEHHELA